MRIQCDACEEAEAEVLCCADEAVLCRSCDANVHAANKLSQKHHRLFLLKDNINVPSSSSSSSSSSPSPSPSSSSSQLPLCDSCQERKGYVFCLEDRALLCKQCDISTHRASPFLLSHQRFVFSDVKVALESLPENSSIRNQSSAFQTRRPMDDCYSSFFFPFEKESTTMDQLEATSTNTTTTFPAEPHFGVEEADQWPLDDLINTNDFDFSQFSED